MFTLRSNFAPRPWGVGPKPEARGLRGCHAEVRPECPCRPRSDWLQGDGAALSDVINGHATPRSTCVPQATVAQRLSGLQTEGASRRAPCPVLARTCPCPPCAWSPGVDSSPDGLRSSARHRVGNRAQPQVTGFNGLPDETVLSKAHFAPIL